MEAVFGTAIAAAVASLFTIGPIFLGVWLWRKIKKKPPPDKGEG